MYAAGKIPGGFFKREGRPTERAILTARMIDRPIRPLWPKGYRNEVQCIATVLSADMVTSHDILAINGVSAALMISPMPFLGPIGAVRIGLIDGELVVNPTLAEQQEQSNLDLIVVGTKEGLTMVEAGADQVPEDKLLEALDIAHREIVKICEAQEELRGEGRQAEVARRRGHRGARRPLRRRDRARRSPREGLAEAAGDRRGDRCEREAGTLTMELDRGRRRPASCRRGCRSRAVLEKKRSAAVEAAVRAQFEADLRALTEAEQDSKELKSAKQHLLYDRIVDTVAAAVPGGTRRAPSTRRPTGSRRATSRRRPSRSTRTSSARRSPSTSAVRTGVRRPRSARSPARCRSARATHGSALFTRGQTQIMSLVTLGTAKEGQRIDDLSLEKDRRYIHHYNFPPYSVGETGRMTGPRRRDIGHGALAQRALEAVIPDVADFPYTIRVVSETLESNGSSSMGSVCGSTLGLMDAGVPIKEPVSGIAMGLVKEGDDYVILTDIQGAEDHLGDMDFKVAGTEDGHHGAADGHQDHRRLAGDHGAGARAGPGGPRGDPRPDARVPSASRGRSSPATRRGSRPSRSTPSTSAW